MKKINLDKNYNFSEEKSLYENDFVDTVDSITKARIEKRITEREAALLLNLVLKKEFKNEARVLTPFTNQQTETRSMFMHLKTKQVRHA